MKIYPNALKNWKEDKGIGMDENESKNNEEQKERDEYLDEFDDDEELEKSRRENEDRIFAEKVKERRIKIKKSSLRLVLFALTVAFVFITYPYVYLFFAGDIEKKSESENEAVASVAEETVTNVTEESEAVEEVPPAPVVRFAVTDVNGDFSVVTDTDTGVMYLLYDSGYGASREATMCVMYDSEGNVMTDKSGE